MISSIEKLLTKLGELYGGLNFKKYPFLREILGLVFILATALAYLSPYMKDLDHGYIRVQLDNTLIPETKQENNQAATSTPYSELLVIYSHNHSQSKDFVLYTQEKDERLINIQSQSQDYMPIHKAKPAGITQTGHDLYVKGRLQGTEDPIQVIRLNYTGKPQNDAKTTLLMLDGQEYGEGQGLITYGQALRYGIVVAVISAFLASLLFSLRDFKKEPPSEGEDKTSAQADNTEAEETQGT